MDHATIEDQNFVERYFVGRLTASEREQFETHFVDCPQCLDQLEWTEDLRDTLKTVAAENAARTMLRGGLFAFLARRSPLLRATLGLGAPLMPLALTLALLLPQIYSFRGQLAEQEKASEGLRRQMAQLEQSMAEGDRRLEQAERQVRAQTDQLDKFREPQVTPAILLSAAVRGSGQKMTRFPISDHQRVVFEVDAVAFASFRATLLDDAGRQLWQAHPRPDPWGTIQITFPPGYFRPGDYRLDFAGLEDDGRAVELGSFPLRAEP
ncbi:MAG: hypothetical protein GY856_36500 [bacterium]|nr:hypothetical protein [bacterium]